MATEKVEEIILTEEQDKEFTNGRGNEPAEPLTDSEEEGEE